MPARVRTGARLQVGFLNLSLARDRIYGGIGFAVDEPGLSVSAERADSIECDDPDAAVYARRSVELLEVPGARVAVESALPRHVGVGSGTQLALAVYAAIATAYDRQVDVRRAAPALDRGGRSGVGVAVFERGGFVIDAGHPRERFTTDRPPRGEWSVPPVAVRHDLPEDWRFVLVRPDLEPGVSGDAEDDRMRAAIERASPGVSEDIATTVALELLPAIATGDHAAFGNAVAEIDRLNGVWYTDEQGGVYRPRVGAVVDELDASRAVAGTGQSSWGPTVYAVTEVSLAGEARRAGESALEAAGVDGDVTVVAPRNRGAAVDPGP
ncbi:MAG: beta-ribofuranosylaminobenzene 5'-phosphate synthase family protein [Halobacteriales archaeon]